MTTDEYGRAACVCGYVPPTHTHADDCPVFGTQARAQAPTPAPATPAESESKHGIGCGCWSCLTGGTALGLTATPAVELTPDELRALADIVEAHEHSPEGIGPMTLRGGLLAIVDSNGASVLRIGGDK